MSFRYGGFLQSVDNMLKSVLQGSGKSTAMSLQLKAKPGSFLMWNTVHWAQRRLGV